MRAEERKRLIATIDPKDAPSGGIGVLEEVKSPETAPINCHTEQVVSTVIPDNSNTSPVEIGPMEPILEPTTEEEKVLQEVLKEEPVPQKEEEDASEDGLVGYKVGISYTFLIAAFEGKPQEHSNF